ncbi:hypothetical protein NSK_005634 [Nannochloropsis salina CCMP1776]|uniref:Condensin II complex subunit H2 N-terminal domain-containing protein n=1 Tax=Nannochloropsis salina CCMP1776 TaxID=1027361 RepID=A0A4D9CZL0_9STRA|nr:hypothetical protein NSK_005634 [Nannochloropsis salina CCMP1776]|eukprot:TFJ83063.1 hypothetical protein NSK_005634 [Nannochloropsis salina CCMP1776]
MGDSEEARFSHLLQPIRDLARNWDIDIASSLEDYLDELDGMEISLDGGQTNLNFAEAALLIQEQRLPFDIHHCGDEILGCLDKETFNQEKENGGDSIFPLPKKASHEEPKKGGKEGGREGGKEGEEEDVVRFQEMVSGKEQYEVCRLFLASLQLANNGNVQLVHQESNKDANGLSFRLKLLSDQRMHERFTGTELGNIDM